MVRLGDLFRENASKSEFANVYEYFKLHILSLSSESCGEQLYQLIYPSISHKLSFDLTKWVHNIIMHLHSSGTNILNYSVLILYHRINAEVFVFREDVEYRDSEDNFIEFLNNIGKIATDVVKMQKTLFTFSWSEFVGRITQEPIRTKSATKR